MTAVRLSTLADDIVELAYRDELTPAEDARWCRLVTEWEALRRRIEEGRN